MIYFAEIDEKKTAVTLSDEQCHHILTVKRRKPGSRLSFTNGQGVLFSGTITCPSVKRVTLEEIQIDACREKEVSHTLVQALSKSQLMETIVQKTTELGIGKIHPVISERVVALPPTQHQRQEKQQSRYQRIAIEACKQSENIFLPQIAPPLQLSEYLEQRRTSKDKCIFLDLNAPTNLYDYLQTIPRDQSFTYAIGPEGGFSDSDRTLFCSHNYQALHINTPVLRLETAAIAILAILAHRN